MLAVVAALPLIVILTLMLGFGWDAVRAGVTGLLAAVGIAWLVFGADFRLLGIALLKSGLLSLDVLLIVWGAFLFYRVTDEAGIVRMLGDTLPLLTPDPAVQGLIIGWTFAAFLQGFGGFGVPAAVAAPILAELGFAPFAALLMPSLGSAWAVTFGSLGSAFQALLVATGLPAGLLAGPAALYLGVAGVVAGLMIVYVAAGWGALRRQWRLILLLGLVMGGIQYVVALTPFWNISAFLAGIAGMAAVVGWVQLERRIRAGTFKLPAAALRRQSSRDVSPSGASRHPWVSLSGYLILACVTIGVQATPPVRDWLARLAVLRFEFPELHAGYGFVTPAGPGRVIALASHAGAMLAVSSLLSFWLYHRVGMYKTGAFRRILTSAARAVAFPSLGIILMVSMGVIMEHAGMTQALAQGLAQGVGVFFPLVAPWIGALGAWITGSNTNSNAIFAGLQLRTARLLGLPAAAILAGQTAGGALASTLSPAKMVVGTSTSGIAGREGEAMRRLTPYIFILVMLISLLTAIGVGLG